MAEESLHMGEMLLALKTQVLLVLVDLVLCEDCELNG